MDQIRPAYSAEQYSAWGCVNPTCTVKVFLPKYKVLPGKFRLSDALVVSQFGLISAVHVLVVSWHTGSEPEFSQEVGKHPNE